MRWLIRLLLFWAISLPLFYMFGLPAALDMLSNKARTEAFSQCTNDMRAKGMVGSANSPVNPVQGEIFCHCVSDSLEINRSDLMAIVRKQPPAHLNAMIDALSKKCHHELQQMLGFLPPDTPPETPIDPNLIQL